MANSTNYLTLITNAISDFDKVWTALNEKGNLVDTFLKDKTYDDKMTPTSVYGQIIGLLSYIPGLSSNEDVPHYTTSDTKGFGQITGISKGTSAYTVSTSISSAGYYDASTKLEGSVPFTAVSLAGNKDWILSNKVYSLSADDYIIGAITASQGTVKNEGEIGFDTNKAPSTTVSLASVDGTTVKFAEENVDTGFKVKVQANANTTATVKATVTNEVTEGYVVPDDKAPNWSDTQEIDSSKSETIELILQAGSVKVQSVGTSEAVASITSKTAGVVIDATDKEEGASYIELESAIEGLNLEAEVTEGYVAQGKVNANASDIKLGKGTKYIKVGSSNDQTITLTADELAVSAGTEYLDTTGKAVTITLPATTTRSADVDSGYITNTGTITLAGTKTVNIKSGTGIAKSKITTYGLSKVDSALKLSDTNTTGAYAFTVTPNVTVDTTGTSAGWIDSITTGKHADDVASKTYYIEAGSVSVGGVSFDAEVIERNDDNNDGTGTVAIGDIFYNTVPAKGDYIKINAGFTYSATEGYIKSIASTTPSVDRYLKKAVIALEEKDGEERFVVTQAGYLPSGTLKEISSFAPTEASVAINLTGIGLTATAPSTNDANKYHTITVSKGLTDAGYISASEGDVTGIYYLQKGSVTTNTTLSAVPVETIAREEAADGTVTYLVRSEVTANAGRTVTEGYVTETEVSGTVEKKENVDYHVNRAVFGTTTHTTNASITAASGIRLAGSGETSAYTVTPKIDSCSTVFTLTSAGYISSADADILKFENAGTTHNGTMSPVSIHKGTGIVSHTETHTGITASDDFATAEGDYTITVGGTVASAITLDDGYYGANEKSFNANFNVAKTYTVNRGSATVTTSGTTTMNAAANGVVLHSETDVAGSGKTYFEIGATTTINATKGNITNGYMKTDDITVSGNSSSGKAYVESFESVTLRSEENPAPTGTAKFDVTVGQTSSNVELDTGKVLATAEKFNKKDISITLTENAMGSGVVAQLEALAARLTGETANIVGK